MNREPPHNLEAERAVIGCGLVYGDPAITESEALRPDEFFMPQHREAWKAITEAVSKGAPTDPINVGMGIKAAGMAAHFSPSWHEWAMVCAGEAVIPQQVSHYAKIVREKAASRRLIETCTNAIALAYGDQPWEQQIRALREGSAELENLATDCNTVHVSAAIREAADDVERQQRGEGAPRVYFGISTLDRVMDGAEPGDLVIVAARPGIGKSAFVGNVAAFCGMHNVPTAFFSVEMLLKRLGRRWLSGDANINSNKLKSGNIDVAEWGRITASAGRFDSSLLWVNDRATRLGQITGEASRWHARHVSPRFAKSGKQDDKRAVVVLDYAQRVKVGREKGDTREMEVAKIPTEMKGLAKDLDCVVILVAMLGREVEKRGGDPVLSDLRESGAFEQEADIVLLLAHGDEGDRIIVAKNREGQTGAAKCRWEKEITTWHSATEMEDDGQPDTRATEPHWNERGEKDR